MLRNYDIRAVFPPKYHREITSPDLLVCYLPVAVAWPKKVGRGESVFNKFLFDPSVS